MKTSSSKIASQKLIHHCQINVHSDRRGTQKDKNVVRMVHKSAEKVRNFSYNLYFLSPFKVKCYFEDFTRLVFVLPSRSRYTFLLDCEYFACLQRYKLGNSVQTMKHRFNSFLKTYTKTVNLLKQLTISMAQIKMHMLFSLCIRKSWKQEVGQL